MRREKLRDSLALKILLIAVNLLVLGYIAFLIKSGLSSVAFYLGWAVIGLVLCVGAILLMGGLHWIIFDFELCPKGGIFHRRRKNAFGVSSHCRKCGKLLDNFW